MILAYVVTNSNFRGDYTTYVFVYIKIYTYFRTVVSLSDFSFEP